MEAASLIEHAKQLSDIRADGAPAFRLRMNFRAIAKDGSVLEGAYSEVWVSKAQTLCLSDYHPASLDLHDGASGIIPQPGCACGWPVVISDFGRL